MKYYEYIWLDGSEPDPQLRSKTKIVSDTGEAPIWGFDGSSTNQAAGSDSDCVLKPVKSYKDPFRSNGELVLCEVFTPDGKPHETNHRKSLVEITEAVKGRDPWFGLEQEYTMLNSAGQPIGFEEQILKDVKPQGDYYCGVGSSNVFGREISEEHAINCETAGVHICGINAEVMPGQWEYQVGTSDPVTIADDVWIARWILHRTAEAYKVEISFDPKPTEGDWNGAGAHTNFSTKSMRSHYDYIEKAAELLGTKHKEHIEVYGSGNERRLTGAHETCDINTFKWGVSDRGASIRIPWQVAKVGYGYLEDRRPSANCDPYKVFAKILDTVCIDE